MRKIVGRITPEKCRFWNIRGSIKDHGNFSSKVRVARRYSHKEKTKNWHHSVNSYEFSIVWEPWKSIKTDVRYECVLFNKQFIYITFEIHSQFQSSIFLRTFFVSNLLFSTNIVRHRFRMPSKRNLMEIPIFSISLIFYWWNYQFLSKNFRFGTRY